MPSIKQFALDGADHAIFLYSDGTIKRRRPAEMEWRDTPEWHDVELEGVEGKVVSFAVGLNAALTVLTIGGRLFQQHWRPHTPRSVTSWREVSGPP
jgi:hypothetical protein